MLFVLGGVLPEVVVGCVDGWFRGNGADGLEWGGWFG